MVWMWGARARAESRMKPKSFACLAIKGGVSILHLQGWEKRVGGKCMWQEDEMFWTFQVPYRHPSGAVSR